MRGFKGKRARFWLRAGAAAVVAFAAYVPTLAGAQDVARPLGTLLAHPDSGQYRSGSVLPQGWNSSGAAGVPAPVAAPDPSASGARPLGTLFNAPAPQTAAPATQAIAPAPRIAGQRIQARTITPAHRVQAAPAADASSARPLGTLFGPSAAQDTEQEDGGAPGNGGFTTASETRAGGAGEGQRPARTAAPLSTPAQPGSPTGAAADGDSDTENVAEPEKAPEPVVPAEFSAENLTYDREMGIVTATGNVHVIHGTRELIADKVSYDQNIDVVIAEGNVSLTDETEQLLFGDRMEITGDLRDGVIYHIGLVLADRSRVAGSGARRSDGVITDFRNAIYSPCRLCPDDPTAPPIWQLKAVRVIHDAGALRVSYRDAWLEVFGVPVLYTPYLSHPDPTVKRRSGFLVPSFSSSTDLGQRFETPYYWVISDYQDATFTPLITTLGGSGAIGEYRGNFAKGEIRAKSAFVVEDPDRGERGYIDLESEFHLNRTWRAGFDLKRASDDTFMRRYGFQSDAVLVSRGYLEGFRGRNYQSVSTYFFDDLRAGADSDISPVIFPIYDYKFAGERDRLGGFTSFDFNALNLSRSEGTDTRRIAFRPRWDRPFAGAFGDLYTASVSLAADGYHSTNVTLDDGSSYTGFSGRLLPRATLAWQMPLLKAGQDFNQTLEPLASFSVSPNGSNSDKIPNEDSQFIEFDETSLFDEDKFDGFDRVDSGMRFNYGVRYGINDFDGHNLSAFIGQSYTPRPNATFTEASGMDDNFSDIIGRVQLNWANLLTAVYRTQLRPENLSTKRNEISASIGPNALRFSTNYAFIDSQPGGEFAGREEISNTISSQMTRYWKSSFSVLHDIAQSDLRSVSLSIGYEDECVALTTNLSRSFYQDRDIKPTDAITLQLVLKTLGETSTDFTSGQN